MRSRLVDLLTIWGNSEGDGRVMTESLAETVKENVAEKKQKVFYDGRKCKC